MPVHYRAYLCSYGREHTADAEADEPQKGTSKDAKERIIYQNFVSVNLDVKNMIDEITKFKVNAERKSKGDDNTAKMQSIKWLGV